MASQPSAGVRLPLDDARGDEVSESHGEPTLASLGKFRFVERIGRGGMGDVYLALSGGPAGFEKLVVVKVLRDDFAAYRGGREMFLDEGRLVARFNHPNVVQANEVGVEAGRHYLMMEYLEGQPLDQLMARVIEVGVRVSPGLWVRVALDALAGLDYAHELTDFDGTPLNVVHRDLSPHNLFLTYEGVVKVLDFGIAKSTAQSEQTQAGTVKGKIGYMAPEQLLGHPLDRRADIFVFGIVLWEMFTGQRLFTDSVSENLRLHHQGALPRVSSIVPGFDPALDAVIARALAFEPGERFPTARALRDALAAAAPGARGIAPPEAVGELVSTLFREQHDERRRAVRRYASESVRKIATLTPDARTPSPGVTARPLGAAAWPPGLLLLRAPAAGRTNKARTISLCLIVAQSALALAAASSVLWLSAGRLGGEISVMSRAMTAVTGAATNQTTADPSPRKPPIEVALLTPEDVSGPMADLLPRHRGARHLSDEVSSGAPASHGRCVEKSTTPPGAKASPVAPPLPMQSLSPSGTSATAPSKRTFRTEL
jgi:serine/threonine protein kinase